MRICLFTVIERLSQVRKDGMMNYLRPDGKSQVTVRYIDGEPKSVEAVVISSQHAENITQEQLHEDIMKNVIKYVIPEKYLGDSTKYHINPTGVFVIGGPQGDCGFQTSLSNLILPTSQLAGQNQCGYRE